MKKFVTLIVIVMITIGAMAQFDYTIIPIDKIETFDQNINSDDIRDYHVLIPDPINDNYNFELYNDHGVDYFNLIIGPDVYSYEILLAETINDHSFQFTCLVEKSLWYVFLDTDTWYISLQEKYTNRRGWYGKIEITYSDVITNISPRY